MRKFSAGSGLYTFSVCAPCAFIYEILKSAKGEVFLNEICEIRKNASGSSTEEAKAGTTTKSAGKG